MSESSESTASVRPNRKLFEQEWLEIISLAKNGTSITKIAGIYDVHHTVLYRGLKKRGVKIGSLVTEASEEEAEKNKAELIRKIQNTKENDYKFTEFLQQQIVKIVSESVKPGGGGPGSRMDCIKTLKAAIDGVRNGTANKWMILGLDKENSDADAVLPELPIREMTTHEVDAIRNRQELEDGLTPAELEAAMQIGSDLIDDPSIVDDDEELPPEGDF